MQMSLWELIWHASLLVKIVMFLLAISSVVSWSIIFKKRSMLKEYQIKDLEFLTSYQNTPNLNDILRKARETHSSSYALLFQKGYEEFLRINKKFDGADKMEQLHGHFSSFGLEAMKRAMSVAVNELSEKWESDLTWLASIGAVSPFVGLLGTVWGIIDAFSGLSGASASLETVAPGIAEALVTTAIGLLAAIPAVLFYNYFQRTLLVLHLKMESFEQDFLNMLERLICSPKS